MTGLPAGGKNSRKKGVESPGFPDYKLWLVRLKLLIILYNYLLGHESRCSEGVLHASSEKKKKTQPALRKQFGQKKSQFLARRAQKGAWVPAPVGMTSDSNRYQSLRAH